ncbi:agmatine deiminase family protein [Streptomyces cyaneofuscatus]|uniref:Agmatine deiminase family protein n=1 Tax=Streptomyces cyaneofuscatus TaxID=66883 RepID=A0ABZ1EQ80_9ACTN|nr:agmatine deiminase family protein [Streptomyces cyaneofuscatus]WSB06263.1 agmatine deiminase family protein [Streptomyces cyaneofuscatus]WSD50203.1 agmatine deiminase family protein [Streptomyces cyaneofuscatus]WTA93701.1 agmatine deiminase family protein [Streptomyces cyaneofuscatus]
MSHRPPTRRTVLRTLTGLGALAFGAVACGPDDSAAGAVGTGSDRVPEGERRFGAEWDSHARTFMSWPALESVWEEDLPYVREDIARIARAIAEYEYVVMMARPDQQKAAQRACGSQVEVIPLAVDDMWARDTVPVFVEEGGEVIGVDFNFNGWGEKQEHTNDARVGRTLLSKYGIPRVEAPLVAEGGSFETDGEGTLLITESSIVNENRNPGLSRDDIEADLIEALGVEKVVWLKGVRGQDITDAHVDSLVRFTAPGVVLLDQAFPGTPPDSWSRAADQAREVLSKATDARGRRFEVIDLPQPDLDRITGEGDDFVSTYANFYVANDSVFMPRFGDRKADDRARGILQEQFPDRDIVPVVIDTVASGGGGIHCATHDQPGKPVS